METSRKPYPSDVFDEEWSLMVPYLTLQREDAGQREHSLREVFNGLRYIRFDTVGVLPLIDGVQFGALIADAAFDSNAILAKLNERGAKIVIAQHQRRTRPCRSMPRCTDGVI